MTYKERKRARLMYLFPLMLALTGLALLFFEWALAFDDLNALQDLKAIFQHNWYILILPLALMILCAVRVPPLGAYIAAGVAALLFLIQLVIAFLLGSSGGNAAGLVALVPGNALFVAIRAIKDGWTLSGGVRLFAHLSLVLSNLSAVFSCMYYVRVKTMSDRRRANLAKPAAAAAGNDADPDLDD